jgi:hypothetical protein
MITAPKTLGMRSLLPHNALSCREERVQRTSASADEPEVHCLGRGLRLAGSIDQVFGIPGPSTISRGSGVMPRHGRIAWSIGHRRCSGMPSAGRGARRRPRWSSTSVCASTSRTASLGPLAYRAGRWCPVRSCPCGRDATSHVDNAGGGQSRGAPSGSPVGYRSSSRMTSRCESRMRRSTERSMCKAAERSNVSWSPACARAARCGFPAPAPGNAPAGWSRPTS